MSRFAQVIVLAPYAEEVMDPLTRPDPSRSWRGHFESFDTLVGGWLIEFERVRPREGLLKHLESLAWPNPSSVQVLIHDEDDDCFGLWMMQAGVLTEVSLPGHRRVHLPAPATDEYPPHPGCVWREDGALQDGLSTERQEQGPAW